ncbi:MAG: hypothetical protein IJY42_02045, partial [Clostridia bacterium]|nr:hypothetical protein [Clostridia bacterium]
TLFLLFGHGKNGLGIYWDESTSGGIPMCQLRLSRVVGICTACFGAGIFLSFLLPGYILAFLEAALIVATGILLLWKKRC